MIITAPPRMTIKKATTFDKIWTFLTLDANFEQTVMAKLTKERPANDTTTAPTRKLSRDG